jgi:hypothetical protein
MSLARAVDPAVSRSRRPRVDALRVTLQTPFPVHLVAACRFARSGPPRRRRMGESLPPRPTRARPRRTRTLADHDDTESLLFRGCQGRFRVRVPVRERPEGRLSGARRPAGRTEARAEGDPPRPKPHRAPPHLRRAGATRDDRAALGAASHVLTRPGSRRPRRRPEGLRLGLVSGRPTPPRSRLAPEGCAVSTRHRPEGRRSIARNVSTAQ